MFTRLTDIYISKFQISFCILYQFLQSFIYAVQIAVNSIRANINKYLLYPRKKKRKVHAILLL